MFKPLVVLFALFVTLLSNILLLVFLDVDLDGAFYQETAKAFVPNLLGLIFAVIVVESLISINRKSSYKKLNTFSSKVIHGEIEKLLQNTADLLEINKDKKELIQKALESKNFELFIEYVVAEKESLSHDFSLKIENGDFKTNFLKLIDDEFYVKKLTMLDESLKEGFDKISTHLEKIKPHPAQWVRDLVENEFSITLQYAEVLLKQEKDLKWPLSKEQSTVLLKGYANLSESLFRKFIVLSRKASDNLLFAVID